MYVRCTQVNLHFVQEYQNIVRRKHCVAVHGMRCTANYVKTFPDH